MSYMVNETDDAVNIFLLLDQPSCRSIIIIASPQERLTPPSATGNITYLTILSMPVRMEFFVFSG